MSPDAHADATALPPFWPARQHTALHDELHARPPLLVRPGSIVSCWVNWRMDPAGAERALAALCESQGQPAPAPADRPPTVVPAASFAKAASNAARCSCPASRAAAPAMVVAHIRTITRPGNTRCRSLPGRW